MQMNKRNLISLIEMKTAKILKKTCKYSILDFNIDGSHLHNIQVKIWSQENIYTCRLDLVDFIAVVDLILLQAS